MNIVRIVMHINLQIMLEAWAFLWASLGYKQSIFIRSPKIIVAETSFLTPPIFGTCRAYVSIFNY